MNYLTRAMERKGEITADRRFLHQHPELGFDLPKTFEYVWNRLTQMGISPKKCGRAGITALIGRPGPVVLLRADMDALPLREESGLPFAADGEYAHCCGHDMHTAMLLGAAALLKETEDSLPGTVKLMFQPAEEILEGAKDMIRAGILESPRVDAAIGLHMLPGAPTGLILCNTGVVSASSNHFHIAIQGKGGHGAMPQNTVDPINVGAHVHIALQELVAREVDPQQPVVLTIGSFQAGEAHNIIPETALMKGTLRTYDKEVRDFLLSRLQEVCELTAKTFRAGAVVEQLSSTIPLVVDPAVAEITTAAWREMLGNQGVVFTDQRLGGSEDFAEVGDRVPSMFFALGGGEPREGYRHSLHHPQVTFNEDCLPVGAAAYAQGAAAWLLQAH